MMKNFATVSLLAIGLMCFFTSCVDRTMQSESAKENCVIDHSIVEDDSSVSNSDGEPERPVTSDQKAASTSDEADEDTSFPEPSSSHTDMNTESQPSSSDSPDSENSLQPQQQTFIEVSNESVFFDIDHSSFTMDLKSSQIIFTGTVYNNSSQTIMLSDTHTYEKFVDEEWVKCVYADEGTPTTGDLTIMEPSNRQTIVMSILKGEYIPDLSPSLYLITMNGFVRDETDRGFSLSDTFEITSDLLNELN